MHTEEANAPNRLRELRGDLPLWRLAHVAQVSESVLSRYETGKVPIPDEVKGRLAAHFNVTRSYLMGWDEADGPVAA